MLRENILRWPTILMGPFDQESMREWPDKILLMLADRLDPYETAFFCDPDCFMI